MMRHPVALVSCLAAWMSLAGAAEVGETGASLSELSVLHGNADFTKAKLVVAEFWALG